MAKNMGSLDRTLRIIVALVLGFLLFTGQLAGTWAVVAGVVAAIFLITSLVGFCPLYRLVGMDTCGKA